ncbi:hypothetical protein, partial [Vibrio cyclitrophicus]
TTSELDNIIGFVCSLKPNFITSSLVAEWLKTDTNIRKKKIINLCADPTSLSLPINALLRCEQRNA